MNALVRTLFGTYVLDLETEDVISTPGDFAVPEIKVALPRVVATAASGATVVAVVDPLDWVAASVNARVKSRRPTHLRSLRDLDLVAEGDAAVTNEVHRKRAGCGAGRRILRDTGPGREHPRLPPLA